MNQQEGMSALEAEAVFLQQLPWIDKLVVRSARRLCLRPDEIDDFRSWMRVRLIDNDYAIVCKHRGESRMESYLAAVVLNLARDFRIQRMGKWRQSACARRLGQVAGQLETLTARDGFGLEEAINILRRNFNVGASEAELHDLAAQLPPRLPRQLEGGEATEALTAKSTPPLDERHELAARASKVLRSSLADLPDQDRLLLRLNFEEGLSIAKISRLLGVEQRPLYSRRARAMRMLRRDLEAAGLDRDQVLALVGWDASALEVDYCAHEHTQTDERAGDPKADENQPSRPSSKVRQSHADGKDRAKQL